MPSLTKDLYYHCCIQEKDSYKVKIHSWPLCLFTADSRCAARCCACTGTRVCTQFTVCMVVSLVTDDIVCDCYY
jgi:hypothetical protein